MGKICWEIEVNILTEAPVAGIFIADIENEDAIEKLARVTRCLISTVGPFLRYGQPVLEACSLNGTHYVDSTPETPWVREMIHKYHKTAQVNGAIVRTGV